MRKLHNIFKNIFGSLCRFVILQSSPNVKESEEKPELTPVELVDAAYDLVFRYDAESPAQKKWKERWLSNARKYGAGLDC